MRILLLTHAFNALAQRLHVELAARGHELAVEFDVNDTVSTEAVRLFAPELVVAPFLKRAIPEAIWRHCPCFVVHPGPVGDRGPSSLDWAILLGAPEWGVTVLQANAVLDGGDVWAWRTFPMRAASKASLYRREVTQAAVEAVLEAVGRFGAGCRRGERPESCRTPLRGEWRPAMTQADRHIDWSCDDTSTVLRKIRSADGTPGVLDRIGAIEGWLFGAHPEGVLRGVQPGALIARRHGAICRATVDGAVWIGQFRRKGGEAAVKLPAVQALGDAVADLPESDASVLPQRDSSTWQDIAYEEAEGVGYLAFDFHNGAMCAADCVRLREAFLAATRRDTRVVVLLGGADFWSNGIHLNAIEAASSPADESWRNIHAMDDLCQAILECGTHLTVAAMRANAGAGGVFLALAADRVLARSHLTLNPHYRDMGNLYGSEYWTYLLPRRIGWEAARRLMTHRLPIGSEEAARTGLVDACVAEDEDGFQRAVRDYATGLARDPRFAERLEEKRAARRRDEAAKPLAAYREEELAQMRLNFYGFDPSYHFARYHFVHKVPHARTPLHLAPHRRGLWRRMADVDPRTA